MWSAFSDRYVFARYDDGGVVVDLESGNYYRVNRAAIAVCEAVHLEKDQATREGRIARELKLTPAQAADALRDVLAALDTPTVHGEIQGSYHLYPADLGYDLRHEANTVLNVARDGSNIAIPMGASAAGTDRLQLYVRAVLPKLITRHGVTVLHAAACLINERLVAFSGVSRAGKTTTARAFVEAGARLVSEEWIVFAPDRPEQVLTGGEAALTEWARSTAMQLARDGTCALSPSGFVADIAAGPAVRLERILFLDSTRRRGDDFSVRALPRPDALAELLRHDFLGAADKDSWRRFFESAVALVARVDAYEAWAPETVLQLKDAAARYASTTAS